MKGRDKMQKERFRVDNTGKGEYGQVNDAKNEKV